jgi:hypothetical protein
MWTTKDGFVLRRRWGTVLLIISSACTGVASLPGGGTDQGPGTAGAAGAGGAAGANGGGGAGNATGAGNANGMGAATGNGAMTPGPTATGSLANGLPTAGPLDAGRVIMRRLNVTEWGNTVRDLLGTATVFTSAFPGDGAIDNFDTVGEALSYSDLLFGQQNTAAAAAVTELLARPVGDPIRSKVMLCEPTTANAATCYSTVLTGFMKSAYRRPATAAEVQALVTLATTVQTSATTAMNATPAIEGLKAALETVLISPNFLFHVELGSPNYSLTSTATTPLTDYEVASRLSYFLWSTMPDATLTAAADMGMLAKGGSTLGAQVTRMLADPKAQALALNFAGQWLSVRDTSMVSPDPTIFTAPEVDDALIASIAPESYTFFNALVTGNQPLTALVTADYSYINGRLATFYGVTGVAATQTSFTKVSLASTPRTAGILTQETFLTTTSLAARTSPVKRGNWVLGNMLCSPPPAPPPNVPLFPVVKPNQTVRQTLDQHASIPGCSSCHQTIDPAGYPFENFDAIGAYRTTDNGVAVDPSGSLVLAGSTTPSPVTSAAQMGQLVAKDPRFVACVVKQALTYGLGRTFDTADASAYITTVAAPLQSSGTWASLLQAVATSEAFLTTRGGP